MRRYYFTDETWNEFEAFIQQVPPANRCGKKPMLSERMFFEAVIFLFRTSIPWRDLPTEFGCWLAVYQRFRRWVDSGRIQRLFTHITANPQFDGDIRRIMIDSTIVRAHQHSAGAARKKRRYRLRNRKNVKRLVGVAAA